MKIPRQRCSEHACYELTAIQWSHHEPTLPDAPPRPAYACRSMPAVHGIHDVHCLDVPLCQVLKTGRREHERPVNPGAKHTRMVCTRGCAVKWLGWEPPGVGLARWPASFAGALERRRAGQPVTSMSQSPRPELQHENKESPRLRSTEGRVVPPSRLGDQRSNDKDLFSLLRLDAVAPGRGETRCRHPTRRLRCACAQGMDGPERTGIPRLAG